MKKTIGILAHVDAGKTTFSEQVLFHTGAIRSAGRVDHRDAFLDLHPVERERGITVFAEQAMFEIGKNSYYWLDTPGHADFSSEMEHVLPVLDYAVLIVSCVEGVEGHTETVWRLLEEYGIPTLIFVNKTDRTDADFDRCLDDMRRLLSRSITDLRGFDGEKFSPEAAEAAAECDEELLDALMEDRYSDELWKRGLIRALRSRNIFPVFAGAALQGSGIDVFLKTMDAITETDYDAARGEPFAARVFKIRHDAQGARLAHLKIMQGGLAVKDDIDTPAGSAKINDLRLVHGGKSISVASACAGDIVCVPGLAGVRVGDGLGVWSDRHSALRTEPMLEVAVLADPSVPRTKLMEDLRLLEEEDPALGIRSNARTGEISLRVMGTIQMEIIARTAKERFGLELSFGPPRILYMETIKSPVVGIGHYEPLKHYAEVWLRLVPETRGSGIRFVSKCHVDKLALNWQRLIETHVFERTHFGVLTGAPLTDVRVELIAGRSHLKHTEGGDFRESTYRAIRNALMQAQNVLLEPVCRFSMRMPADAYGRVMGDLNRMRAQTDAPQTVGEWMCVNGECAYKRFAEYPETFRAVTHGRGGLNLRLSRYAEAEDAAAVIREAAYNPLEEDTPDSVFCAHGAGYSVPWNEVRAHAHCEVEIEDGCPQRGE